MLSALIGYIEDFPMPVLADFLANTPVPLKYGITQANLYDWPEFREHLDRMFKKQENYLVTDGLTKRNAAFNMFLLKQQWIGYKDRVEQDITTDGEKIEFTNLLPRPSVKKKKA